MSVYTVRPGQSLIDVAIQVYGSLEAMFDLCLDNQLEMDDDLATGQELLIRDVLPDTADADIVAYYQKKGIIVNSGLFTVEQLFEDEFEFQFE